MQYLALSKLRAEQTEAVKAIYEEAFAAWQRVPFEILLQADTDPSRLQLAMVDDGEVLALAVLSRLKSVSWWFLEYFAVTKARRGNGLGGVLWEAVVERLNGDRDVRIVIEVEPPEEAPPGSDERTIRERRIEFYRRRGARPLDVPVYRVPHLSDNGTGELMLLAVPSSEGGLPSGEELQALVRALYVEGYGLSTDHPLLQAAIASLEDD